MCAFDVYRCVHASEEAATGEKQMVQDVSEPPRPTAGLVPAVGRSGPPPRHLVTGTNPRASEASNLRTRAEARDLHSSRGLTSLGVKGSEAGPKNTIRPSQSRQHGDPTAAPVFRDLARRDEVQPSELLGGLPETYRAEVQGEHASLVVLVCDLARQEVRRVPSHNHEKDV